MDRRLIVENLDRDQKLRVVEWFEEPAYVNIVWKMLMDERDLHQDRCLRLAGTDGHAIEAAHEAGYAKGVQRVLDMHERFYEDVTE